MLNCSHLKTSDVGQWKGSESDPDCGDGVITEPSEARRQRGRRARGDAGHVAEHGRGAGTQVDQVVLCGLIQHLCVKKDRNCVFMMVEQKRSLWLMRRGKEDIKKVGGKKGWGGQSVTPQFP